MRVVRYDKSQASAPRMGVHSFATITLIARRTELPLELVVSLVLPRLFSPGDAKRLSSGR